MGGGDEQFCLRWNDYHESMVATLQELRAQEDFVDVTLVCDGAEIRAHKLILSACSDFFRHLLKRTPPAPATPVIVLWDISAQDLRHILRYMYNGEVEVQQANLNNFLAVAERLRVRGLCQSGGNSSPIHPTAAGTSGGLPNVGNKRDRDRDRGGSLSPRPRSPPSHHGRRASMDPQHGQENKKQKLMSTSGATPAVIDPEISIKEESIRGGASGPNVDKDNDLGGPSDYSGINPDDGTMMSRRSGASDADDYAEYGYGGGNGSRGAVMDDDDGAYSGEGGSGGHPNMPLMGLSVGGERISPRAMFDPATAKGGDYAGDYELDSDSDSYSHVPTNKHYSSFPMSSSSAASAAYHASNAQRINFTREQLATLEDYFSRQQYPSMDERAQLAEEVGVTTQKVSVWFANSRARKKPKSSSSRR